MNNQPKILFVDDEATAVKYFQRAIEPIASVATASSVEDGRKILDAESGSIQVLVSDQRMPGTYGNELLQYAHDHHPNIIRILTTAYSELDNTIEAVNQGQIHRYIRKPWDIDTLRMEMKQALDLGSLRREHAALLREKLMVRQLQMISSRIGTLHALCASLSGADQSQSAEVYLAAAQSSGDTPPQPDWLHMDYSDLVSAESFREGDFGRAVLARLTELRQEQPATSAADAMALLPKVLDGAKMEADGSVLFAEKRIFSEFLAGQCESPVSMQHASWLAYLIWLHTQGHSLQVESHANGMRLRPSQPAPPLTQEKLAIWIENFLDGAR